MKLQNIILPSPDTCTIEDMYFRRSENVEFTWADKKILLRAGGSVYFDTYFNGFSISKWKKYSRIENVNLNLKFKGKLRVTLIRKERMGQNVLSYFIKEKILESNGEEVKISFDDPNTVGMYTADLFALEETELYEGYYSTEIDDNKIDKIKIALDVCTFKREHFVKKNMKLIKDKILNSDKYEKFKDNLEVFIIDNAKSLKRNELEIGEQLHLIQNKNVGGAGGFTRGLMEIKKASKSLGITHALLMDDDIVIEPESLFRTWVMLSLLKDEYKDAFIGGAMLRLDHQNIQVESGAVWNQGALISRKCGLDLRSVEPCLYNEIEETIDYSAWWYTALPINVVRDDNLPLPIFIRGDDVEYGLRNARRIITMNGICVWHEPFERKYSSSMFYYILRNRLIDNAIHDMVLPKKVFINLLHHSVLSEIYLYRYKNAKLLLEGVSDYLKGIDWFKEQNGDEIHKNVMDKGYKMQYMEDLGAEFDYASYEHSLKEPEILTFKHKVIKRLTVNGINLKAKKWNVVIPVVGGREINVYRAENVVNYDVYSQKGFLTKRDEKEAKECIHLLKEVKKLVNENYEKINEEYKTRCREIMSKDFWKEYLK